MKKCTLKNISFTNDNSTIEYNYELSKDIQKYFNKENPFYVTYAQKINNTPSSIAVIPFLSNIMPIAWFAGFDVYIDEIDEDFLHSLEEIKKIFNKWYPHLNNKGNLISKNTVKNNIEGSKKAMLFSGGVDAFASYIRSYEDTPDLITIHGADIAIDDLEQWNDLESFMHNEELLKQNMKQIIKSNVRDFYTYKVSLLIEDMAWWGKVQHGLSLIGVVAPISYANNYKTLIIASSYTKDIDIKWGSTPEADEKVSWAQTNVIHDGYTLKRQDKVDLIAEFSNRISLNFKLRVCYSELRDQFNCSNCEKCFRTILGLVLAGKNPNNFGFNVDSHYYEKMYNILNLGSSSPGMQYFWWELMEKAKVTENPYLFNSSSDIELKEIKEISEGKIDKLLSEKSKVSNKPDKKLRFILRNKFSSLYNIYKKIK